MSQETSAHSGPAADDTAPGAASQSRPLDDGFAEPLSASQIADLRALAAQGSEAQERYLRLYADFENFKKRAARERDEVRRAAIEGMISRLLPVLDTFDMAMAAAAQPGTGVEVIKAGVQMIQGQLRSVFKDEGLEEIHTAGQDFDPALHDPLDQIESTEVPDGRILKEMRKGYRLKDRLLRPASVVVAKHPANPGENAA